MFCAMGLLVTAQRPSVEASVALSRLPSPSLILIVTVLCVATDVRLSPRDLPRAYHSAIIHAMQRSYESLRAELEDILEQYRAPFARDGSRAGLTRGEAVKRIRQLGFTEGDAERWLGSKPRSMSLKLTSS